MRWCGLHSQRLQHRIPEAQVQRYYGETLTRSADLRMAMQAALSDGVGNPSSPHGEACKQPAAFQRHRWGGLERIGWREHPETLAAKALLRLIKRALHVRLQRVPGVRQPCRRARAAAGRCEVDG